MHDDGSSTLIEQPNYGSSTYSDLPSYTDSCSYSSTSDTTGTVSFYSYSNPTSYSNEWGTASEPSSTTPYAGPDESTVDGLVQDLSETAASAYTGVQPVSAAVHAAVEAFVTRSAVGAPGALQVLFRMAESSSQYTFDSQGRLTGITNADSGVTTLAYHEAGPLASLTDPDGNTTEWLYDDQGRLIQEIEPSGNSKYYAYDDAGNLVRYVDCDGQARQYTYDSEHRVVSETWYANTTDADAQQNAANTIDYAYNSAGRIIEESDDVSSNVYTYDAQNRLKSVTASSVGGPTVVLAYTYQGPSTNPSSAAGSINGTADFVNTYEYDSQGRLTQITQAGQSGGNAVAEKEIDLSYNASGQVASVTRYLDGQLVVVADYEYDASGRLVGLVYHQGENVLASYTWTYSGSGMAVPVADLPGDTWLPNGGLPVLGPVGTREGMLPVRDTAAVTAALLVGDYYSQQSQLISATSTDGTVAYAYDSTGQLLGADYSGSQPDESYTYDANGNRTNTGYVIGDGNRLVSDGTYRYMYDADGNRTSRFVWVDADSDGQIDTSEKSQITSYSWDTRNRLVSVTSYATEGAAPTQIVAYSYDLENRLLGENLDSNGDGVVDHQTRYAYDGRQIIAEFDKDGTGDVTAANLSHRYAWGQAVDQVLADEQVVNVQAAGNVVWPLADNLGTVRDLAIRDAQTGVTSVANHRVYDSFGNLKSETNAAVDCLFGFTGRPLDENTGLQNNTNRWYDSKLGRWASEDPIEFTGQDENLYRYVGNSPTNFSDPTGLDRRIICFGHMWISVDTYDKNGNKIGQVELHFAPGVGYEVLPAGGCKYPNWTWGTYTSNQKQDEALVALWRDLQKAWQEGRVWGWNPVNNCWIPALDFSHYGGSTGPVQDPLIPTHGPLPGGRYGYGR